MDLKNSSDNTFLVASTYLIQMGNLTSSIARVSFQSHIISLIWSSRAPSKILVFS